MKIMLYLCPVLTISLTIILTKTNFMKQKLLFLLVSLLTSVAAMAQWTRPVPQTVDTWKYSTFEADGKGDTVVYYLYNKGAQLFFTEGNEYGTRASVASTGLKVAISKYVPAEGEWDNKTVLFNDFSIVKDAWKQVFIDSETHAYVDHNGQANYWWEIESQGGGVYRIKGADINPNYNSAAYGPTSGAYFGMSYASDPKTTAISPLIDLAEDNTACVDWCFVLPEAYDAYLALNEVYEAAVALGAKIEEAKELGVATTDADVVYANTSSTKEQLVEATEKVQEAINAYKENVASPENPQDLTDVYIPDADFEKNQGAGVWKRDQTPSAQNYQTSGTPGKMGDDTYFLEAWNGSAFKGKIYVPITELPNGVYQFTLSAATNAGNGCYVYAGNDSIEVTTGSNMTPYTVFTRVEDGTLEVGFNMPEAIQNWVGIDDAKLLYLGNSMASYVYWVSENIKKAPRYTERDDLQKAALTEYENILGTDLGAFTTMDQVMAFIAQFDEAVATISENAAAYAEYRVLLEDVEELQLAGYQGDEAETLYDYVSDEADEIMRAKALSTEEMKAETAKLAEMIELVRKNCLVPGMDCTKNLVNPNFDKRVEGWSWDTTMGEPAWGGLDTNPCVERYEQDFNFYQTITGVPNGVYEVRAQAFYRSGGATSDIYNQYIEDPTQDEIITYLYANKSEVPVKSIAAHTYTENLANNCTETATGSGLWIVGGMNSSSEAFLRKSDGTNLDYDNVVMGVVTDGTLTVGIKCINGTKSGRWPLWDNFRLTYVGMDKDAIKELIASYADEIEELEGQAMNDAVLKALENAYATGEGAATGEDAFAALTTLIDAIADAKENVKVYEQLDAALITLSELVENHPTSLVVDKATALYTEVSTGLSNLAYSTAEAQAQIEAVEAMCAQVRVPSIDGASEENPVDFTEVILNNGFETGDLSNWTNSGSLKAQAQNNTSFDNKKGEYYCERWHVNGTIDINQTVAYLPAGKYEISAYAYSEAADCVLYANDQEVSVSTSGLYTVPVVVGEDGKVTFGVKWTDDGSKWTCMDDFTMNFVGVSTAIKDIDAVAAKNANGKYFKNGKIFIMKNGVKYNVAGQKMK